VSVKYRLREALETSVLIFISALLFSAVFQVNEWAFASIEYRHGVNWIFLPAGFRVILVLIMGIPGSTGIMLGAWFIDRIAFETGQQVITLFNGVASGFTPWVIMKIFKNRDRFSPLLQHLTVAELINFTLIYSTGNALVHQLGWWLLDHANVNPLIDIWPMFIGDTVGALIMLCAFKGLLSMHKAAKHPQKSDKF
jgi:hypothetical protein